MHNGAFAQSGKPSPDFLNVSKVITGSDALTPGTAGRIEALLTAREKNFPAKLDNLAKALIGKADRETRLAGLGEDDLDTALAIAKPWYLGYVGSPSARILEDDAAFATYLEAQAWVKLASIVPLQSYAPGIAGWWKTPPPGVDHTDLPEEAKSWNYQPQREFRVPPPDPAWRAYAAGTYDTIEAARAALPKKPASKGKTNG